MGLSPYSGENMPPRFGDFECHRFWMEVMNTDPATTWYTDGHHMNTTYWPIDYPPLCAYSHWLMSKFIEKVQPDALKVEGSYGFSSPLYRTIMRVTLILLELVWIIPVVVRLLSILYPKQSTTTRRLYLLAFLMIPSLIYVDHGHFQPNSVMHGLVLWATYFILTNRIEFAVVAMVLAVNFKQMALYFGLPFGIYALSTLFNKAQQRFKG